MDIEGDIKEKVQRCGGQFQRDYKVGHIEGGKIKFVTEKYCNLIGSSCETDGCPHKDIRVIRVRRDKGDNHPYQLIKFICNRVN